MTHLLIFFKYIYTWKLINSGFESEIRGLNSNSSKSSPNFFFKVNFEKSLCFCNCTYMIIVFTYLHFLHHIKKLSGCIIVPSLWTGRVKSLLGQRQKYIYRIYFFINLFFIFFDLQLILFHRKQFLTPSKFQVKIKISKL